MNQQSSMNRRLRLVLLFGLFLTVAFTMSTSGTGSAPTLVATSTVVKPGEDVVGTGITYGNSGVYFSAFWHPGNDEAEALVGKFAAPMPNGALPAWSRGWPGGGGFDAFIGADVGADGVYYAGASYSQTSDSVGGKERKEIVAKFNLDGTAGADTAGAAWVARQRFYPGSNGYDGDEFFNAARVSVEGGTTYFYGGGHAQENGCNNNYAIRKYTATGATVWQWQQLSGACGGSDINAIAVDGTNVYAAGSSSYAGNVPQILQFSTSSGSAGPSATFSGTLDGYTSGAYTSMAVYGGNIYAAGYLSSGEQQAYLLDEWTTSGVRLAHKVWSSDPTKSNGQQLMGITAVGSRLFVVGYTRNTDSPAAAHNMGGNNVGLLPNSASYHGYGDGVIFEVSPSDGSLISTTSYGTNDGNDQAFTGVTTDGTNLYVIGAQRSAGLYSALIQRYSLGPTATMLTMPAATGSFGGTTTLQATLSSASGPVGGMSVSFSLFGAPVGSATTASNGVATLNNVSLSGPNAGVYGGAAGAFFGDTASYQTSSMTADLTINRAPASISVTGAGTFPYDGSAHSASALVTGVFGESLGSGSITYTDLSNGSTSSAAPTNAGSYRVNASFAGNTNYLDGLNSSITVTIAPASTSTTLQTWSQFTPSGLGPAFGSYGSAEVNDGAGRLIVVTADTSNPFVLSGATGLAGTPTWTTYPAPGHPAQKNAAAAYDPNTNALILYGGCGGGCTPITNQVWVLKHANGIGGAPAWSLLPTSGGPAARQGMARGYDPASHRLVIFGGQNGGGSAGATYPDVWVLTNADGSGGSSTWAQMFPDNAPPPGQYAPSSWYDAASNRLIVAGGGAQGSGTPTNAVWALTNANGLGGTPHWVNLIPEGAAGSPNGFLFRPAAYDAAENRAMVVEAGTSNLWLITNANGLGAASAYNRVTLAAGPSALTDNLDAPYDAANHRLSIVSGSTQLFVLGSADATGLINPSNFGQPVTFTATVSPVAPGSGTPTGTVTFRDGGTTLGTASVNASRQAIFTTSSLSASGSPHAITAAYDGDANFTTSTGSPHSQTVVGASTTTTVSSSQNASFLGQSVTFTAMVSSGSGATATGTVQFKDNGTPIGGAATLSGGVASVSTSSLTTGSHTITADFGGDGNFNPSNGTIGQTVNAAHSSTALTSSVNPSTVGQTVTFNATVAAVAPGAGTPTGTVTFKDGGTTLGSATLNGGTATLVDSSLSVASHSITAVYGGNTNFTSSTSSALTQAVTQVGTSTSLTVLTASWQTKSAMPTARNGAAAAAINGLIYVAGGWNGFHRLTVEAYNPVTDTWTAKADRPYPSQTHPATGVINGKLYTAGGTDCCVEINTVYEYTPATDSWASKASMPTTRQDATSGVVNNRLYVAGGINTVGSGATGTFSTLEEFDPAVGAAGTWTPKASMPTARRGAGGAAADGTFYVIGGQNASGIALNSVEAYDPSTDTWTTKAPMPTARHSFDIAKVGGVFYAIGGNDGTNYLTAVEAYDPSTNTWSTYAPMLTARVYHDTVAVNGTIYAIGGATPLASAIGTNEAYTPPGTPTSSTFGQTVTLTATVNTVAPGSGTAGGTVTFRNASGAVGTAGLNSGGVATFTTSTLAAGSYTFTADYAGSTTFAGSTSSAKAHTVTAASTTTTVSTSANPSEFGQSVTFTANVAGPGGTPSGTLTFNDGATTIGVGTLSGGATTFSTSSLSVGSRSITATYSGDASYSPSTSAVLSQAINAPTPPSASFTANPNPCACNQAVAFDASASSATTTGRHIVNWAWDFGDGTSVPMSGPSQAHAYSHFGTYTVTLTVTDDNVPPLPATATRTVNVNQGNQPPIASASGPYNVNFGGAVQLNGSNSADPNTACGDSIASYSWTIDGTIHLSGATPTLDTAANSLSVGTHNVSLTVTDTFGAIGTASTTLNVSRVLVSIAVTPSSATKHPNQGGQQFTATGTFSDGSTEILQSGGNGGSGGSGGSGGGPSAAHWNIHFTPMIAVSACATAQYPAPIDYSSQAFTPDSTTGAFQEIWSVSTPVLEVNGLLTPTEVTQTLRCTTPLLTTTGEISATWTGTRYEGTFSFGGSTGQVSITGWSSKMPMSSPRAGLGAAFVDGKVYAVGGVGGNCNGTTPCNFGPLTTVESYEPGTNAWMAAASLNVGREGAGVAALGGKIYTIGGHVPGGDPSGVVEVFDPSSSNAWTTLPESEWMPTARAHFALVTDGTYLYAIGGDTQANNLGHVATVERYDPSAHTWSTLTPMPVSGTSSAAGVLNGTIVIVGSDGTSRTDVYDIATNTWHDGVPMPAQRGAMAAGVANGGLWVVGGTGNASPAYDAWVYYPATDRRPEGWGFGGSMPTARWGLAAAVVGDVVYAIGGAVTSSGAFGMTTNESFSTPPFDDLSTSQGSSGGSGGGASSSPTVQWQSTNPSVADVDSNGFANPHALGQTTIVASVGSISGEATFTVSNAGPTVQITGRLGGPLPLPPFAPGPFAINEGSQLHLNAEASDPDGDQLTYVWSILSGTGMFGNQGGNTSSSLNYSNGDGASSATVQIVVTDSFGATATATATITVNNVAPTVTLFGNQQSISEGGFQGGTNLGGGNFSDPGTTDGPWSATVDYGDGTPAQVLSYTVFSGGFGMFGNFSLNHTYGDNGTYTITVSVTDKDHETGTATRNVTVNNVAPQAFVPNSVSTNVGNTGTWGCVSFFDPGTADAPWTATVNYGDGSGDQAVAVNVPATCGGGSTTTGAFNLSHAYANGGSFIVTVNITDKDHATGSGTIQVSVNAPPSVTINSPLGPVDEGSTLNGSGSLSDTSTDGPWTIRITYGDNTGQFTLPQANSPGSFALSHVYKDNGTYPLTVQVTDKFFAMRSTSMNITVNNVVPSVTLPSAAPINEGQSMFITGSFFDPGLSDNQSPRFTGTVNYGDGTPTQNLTNLNFNGSTGQGSFSLNHAYADNPTAPATAFSVTVTVTDKDGGTSTAATMSVTVLNATPGVMLSGGSKVLHGHPATFSGTVFDQGANDAPWTGRVNYGDGTPTENLTLMPGAPPNSPQNTRASFTSTHTYGQSGSFTLTLTATDKDGATGTATFPIHVKPVLVSIAITPSAATMNAPGQTVLFNATATFSDGSTFSTNGQIVDGPTWSSSNANAATIGLGGLATGVAPGTTTITVTGEDDTGGSFSAYATLTVDFAPPVITADDVSAEATSGAGAPVSFSFSATDDFDPHPTVSADHASGATFAIGTTNVIVTAADAAGNSSTKTFHVNVVDTTKPTITLNGANPMTVEGATFTDPGATAVDSVAGDLTAQIQVTGAVDTHVVRSYTLTYSASDGFNTATRTRTVNVVDTTPPALTLPANLTTEATTPGGAMISFSASASDIEDGIRPVNCAPASGSMFAIGTTIVNCSASDVKGNTASGTFMVTVLGSEQIISNLISQVGALDFQQASDLLRNVLVSLSRPNTGAACNQLAAFINQVQAQRNKSLTDAEATALISSATGARGALACQ